MNVNERGLALIREFEGCRLKAYKDAVGIWTIGYGHTSMAGAPHVQPGMVITQQAANAILADDVADFAKGVAKLVTVPLNSNQFSALVAFAFNVGLGALKKSSVLQRVNAGNFAAVPARLALWNKAGGKVLAGLTRRRTAEADLFMAPDAAAMAVAEVQPEKEKDMDIRGLVEAVVPAVVDGIRAEVEGAAGANPAPPPGKSAVASQTIWGSVTVILSSGYAGYAAFKAGNMEGFGLAITAFMGGIWALIGRFKAVQPIR